MDRDKIINFLEKYVNEEINLYEAILISGNWGSGKTYFIKDFIEKIKEENKFVKIVYVSLFGVSSIDEIREKIYEDFHPLLSNKKVKIVKDLLKGAVKSKLKIDLDEQLKKSFFEEIEKYVDIEFNENKLISNIFSYSMKNSKQNKYKTILYVFDDLERVIFSNNITEIFGFINELVEQDKAKVLLIADEEFLNNKFEEYKFFKEKIIAKTFNLKILDIEDVLDSFVKNFDNECENFLNKNKIFLQEIFRNSKSYNLRVFRQILAEWCYLYKEIDDKIKQNERFIDFFRLFLSLSFETKIKNRLFSDISNLSVDEKRKEFLKKYNLNDMISNHILWKQIIFNEFYNINELLFSIQPFKPQSEPPCWYVIGNFYEFDENVFKNCLKKVINEFKECKEILCKDWIFLNIVNTLLYFSEEEIINLKKEEIEEIAMKCIDKFKISENWVKESFKTFYPFSTNFRNYPENKNPFSDIVEKLKIAKNESFNKVNKINKKRDFQRFLNALKTSDIEVLMKILLEDYRGKRFFIGLDDSEINEFFKILKNSPIKSLHKFILALNERFRDNYIILNGYEKINNWKLLKDEMSFYIKLKKLINENLEKLEANRKILFKELNQNLDEIIKKLENIN